jgi:hypothetical protein
VCRTWHLYLCKRDGRQSTCESTMLDIKYCGPRGRAKRGSMRCRLLREGPLRCDLYAGRDRHRSNLRTSLDRGRASRWRRNCPACRNTKGILSAASPETPSGIPRTEEGSTSGTSGSGRNHHFYFARPGQKRAPPGHVLETRRLSGQRVPLVTLPNPWKT